MTRTLRISRSGVRTREQSSLGTTLPNPAPPSFNDFFNLFDHLAFDEAHLVVFRSLRRKRKRHGHSIGHRVGRNKYLIIVDNDGTDTLTTLSWSS